MRRTIALLVGFGLVVAACGGSDSVSDAGSTVVPTTELDVEPVDTDPAPTTEVAETTTTSTTSTTTTSTTTTTVPPEPAVNAADLAEQGPYAVGVVTRALPEGNPVEIWYPAAEGARGEVVGYSVRSFLPEGIAALVPEDVNDIRNIDAARDAAPAADGPFPVVLFSHGASSFRLQSSVLAQHLASWGMVVASTDHPSRDLLNSLGGTAEGQPASVDDFRSLRTFVGSLGDDEVVAGAIDATMVALGGHSAGGGTVVQMAGDEGILGYVSYASALGDEAPEVPSLFMLGELDAIVEPTRTADAFDRAPSPSWLWSFADSGHLAFSDLCAVGSEGLTLIDLAEAAGLGALVDDRLRRLGTDGCEDPNRPVEEVWPAMHQASTGFYRWVFGIDDEPIGLDAAATVDGITVATK